MTPLHIQPLPDSTPDAVQKIDALNRKLGSFIHAPLNLKEVLRMICRYFYFSSYICNFYSIPHFYLFICCTITSTPYKHHSCHTSSY